jgi:hypothetical protein
VDTEAVHTEGMRFDADMMKKLKDFLLNIDNDHIRDALGPEMGERLIQLKMQDPRAYMAQALVTIANNNDSVRQWLFRSADENHKMWNLDGTFKREFLPSDKWTIVELKGAGEVPILKEDLPFMPNVADAWFFKKTSQAHPLDRRFMGKEYDMESNPSGFGRLLQMIQNAIAHKWQMVRPADKDKAYYFDMPEVAPHAGTEIAIDPSEMVAVRNNFTIDLTVGTMLGNVPAGNAPMRALTHLDALELTLSARNVKNFASGGNNTSNEGKVNPPQ